MSTLTALITFAAEEAAHHGGDKTPFYVAGAVLAVWAVIVSGIGIKRHADWPSAKGTTNGIMGLTAVLVLATMVTAITTA